MHIYKRLLPLVFLVFAIAEARAEIRIFMQIPGISGNSTDPAHTGWFELTGTSHQFSVQLDGYGSRSTVISRQFADFTVVKLTDINSPALLLKLAAGVNLPNITIEYVTTGAIPQTFMKIVFTTVLMRGLSVNGQSTSADGKPLEQLRFSFDKIQWTYTDYNVDGTPNSEVNSGWDLTTNTSF